jgi:hypothetical protein
MALCGFVRELSRWSGGATVVDDFLASSQSLRGDAGFVDMGTWHVLSTLRGSSLAQGQPLGSPCLLPSGSLELNCDSKLSFEDRFRMFASDLQQSQGSSRGLTPAFLPTYRGHGRYVQKASEDGLTDI